MLCCFGEIAIFVFGIITLVRGKFLLVGNRVVKGAPAWIIGALLLLPLLIGQGGEFILGAMKGAEKAAKGQPFGAQDVQALQGPALIINAAATTVPLLAAVVIALVCAQPVKRKRRRPVDDYEEDEEDRPRRRRREEVDEDDEPRPRRRREPDDDDDRPRSQRDDHVRE